jgi:hypothetical protein
MEPTYAFFPVVGGRATEPLNAEPVRVIDDKWIDDDHAAGPKRSYRLSITPWDLQRLIDRANELGRRGVRVVGFGYDEHTTRIALNIHPGAGSGPPSSE